ncbi:MAG TPA: efflux transporter outer membrane subunit [Steroidobacteraceae bacterium]|nr:efflux transporter outer membrane subunit [Steroidobacteraceae bacterium]
MHTRLILIAVTPTLLSACALGPDFQTPRAPATATYTAAPQPESTASASGRSGAAQHFSSTTEVSSRWWKSFQCDALNELVEEALARSPTVLEARARLREAQEDLTAQTGRTVYPTVDAQLGVTRQKVDPTALGIPNIPATPPFTLYNAQVNVSYTLDIFGENSRMLEATQAQATYQSYETKAAELTLAANIVSAAIRQADLQAQIDYTRQMLQAQARQLAISEDRYRVGGISLEDLHDQRSRLEQLRAALPPLQAERTQVDHQLAVYTGKPPSEAAIPRFRLEDLRLPTNLPLTLPSELVRRRPDVRASEALWQEASANVGVATANLFPNLTISGSAASQRTHTSDLVDSFNVWSIGAKLLQPIFHGGELRAKKRSAVAAYDAAAQVYAQTVLESLQQVADSLRILEADAFVLESRSKASEESAASYTVAQQRFARGGISELSLLDAQRQHLQTQLDRTHAEAQRFADTAALLHALAGTV